MKLEPLTIIVVVVALVSAILGGMMARRYGASEGLAGGIAVLSAFLVPMIFAALSRIIIAVYERRHARRSEEPDKKER